MPLSETLTDYIRAAFTGLWIQTQEPDEAEAEIIRLAAEQSWRVACWDVAQGLRLPTERKTTPNDQAAIGDPLAVLRALPTLATTEGTTLLVLHQFHRFLNNPEIIQTVFTQLIVGKQQRTFLVVLSPIVQIPGELEKLFVVLEHPLPDREQLGAIARELTSDTPNDRPTGVQWERVLDAAVGLTRYEAEGVRPVCSKSIRHLA